MVNGRRIYFILILSFLFVCQVKAQIGISNTAPNNNANNLIQNILVGSGVTVSNISFSGNTQQIGAFTSGSSIGMNSGIVMSTGYAVNADLGGNPSAANTPTTGVQCTASPNTVCNDLYTVANSVPALVGQFFTVYDINDMCVLEFDFIPESDTLRFNYCFGSEEYLTWVNSSYNDVFGFFISGPGITGPYSSPAGFPNGSQNIAVVPNSSPSLPITVSSVHPGYNGGYYNTGNTTISYNGYTDVFTAEVIVQPCETYHIRLAIADGSDDYLDSGVFLEANSFSSPVVSMGAYGVSIGVDTLTIPCNGTIDLEAQINGNYSVLWNTGDTTNIITASAGQYYFTVSNGSCILNSDTITVVELTQFTTNYSFTDVTCNGLSNGSIDLSVSGGVGPYTFFWIDSISGFTYNTEDLSNISAGNYWCTVTDANGCNSLPIQVIINEEQPISTLVTKTDVSCYGGADGSISLNATGGNAPFSYSWTGPNGYSSNSDPLFSLEAGVYNVSIVDANNCPPFLQQVTILEPVDISVAYQSTDISCYGQNDGAIDLTISGGVGPYSVSWQGPNGFLSNTEDISSLSPGLYTLTVVDANFCLLSSSIQVLINEPAQIVYSSSVTNVLCYGEQNGMIDLTLSGGVGFISVEWTYPDGSQLTVEDLYGVGSGVYNFTITDVNGCSPVNNPLPIFVTEPPQIQISGIVQNELCYGDANGVIDITVFNANGPFSYNWNGPSAFTSSLEDIVGLNSGSYQVIVTDNSNQCTEEKSFVVSAGMQLQVSSIVTDVSCNGFSDGAIDLNTQSLSNPVFAWSNGSTSEDIINLPAGNYSVLLNDDSNCPSYFSYEILAPPVVFLGSTVTEVSCVGGNNGEIEVFVNGGTPPYNYVWSNGNIGPINPFLSEGNYMLTVYDSKNCIVQDSFLLQAEDFHVQAEITNPKCFGGNDGLVDIEIFGGNYPFSYVWSSGQQTQDVINMGAGLYNLSVTDVLNCTIDTLIFVNEPPIINALTSITNVLCFGTNTGSVDIQIVGGEPPYIIDWGSIDTSALFAGVYYYTITDSNECVYSDSILISQNDSLAVNYNITHVQCFGESTGSIDLQLQQGSGTPPYSYQWNGPNMFTSSSEDINNLYAGVYSVIITDANLCTKQIDLVVDEPTALNQIVEFTTSNYTGFQIACKGDNSGWIDVDINGGYLPFSYAWSNGETTDSIFNLYTGNYNLVITDGLGCAENFSLNLMEPSSVMSGIINSTIDYNNYDVSCFGGSDGGIEELVTGGAGNYTYSWNNGMSTQNISNIPAGYYEVIVYDNNGCLWMDSITLKQPDSLHLILQTATDTCERGVGFAEVNVSGGVPLYKYLWSSGHQQNIVNDLSEGMYEIVVLDANLCEISNVAIIDNLESPTIDFLRMPEHKRFYDQQDNPFVFADMTQTHWQNVISWEWDFGDNTFASDSLVYHSYNASGEYVVTLKIETEYNCIDTISKSVLVDEYDIFIPNAFTPNEGDLINNTFKPSGYGINSFLMKIYSRWGEELFSTSSIKEGWDGTINSKNGIAQNGVYLYYIEVENIYGGVFIYQDKFKLIR